MIYGVYNHAIDSKKRVTIPVRHREALGAVCMLVQSSLGCLMLYPFDVWAKKVEAINDRPIEEQNELRSIIFSISAEVVPDQQGRIIIPQSHLEYAKITSGVTIVGSENYDEIWSDEVWAEHNAEIAATKMDKARSIGF